MSRLRKAFLKLWIVAAAAGIIVYFLVMYGVI
jgi:hypothetical protein